jgi:hypothetical protein
MTSAAETGFTKETVFPLMRELISGYATLGDATNALRLFHYALDAAPQAHPLPVVRALEHVLRAIASDDSRRSDSAAMMEEAITQADKHGSWINQTTVFLMMRIHFASGRFEEAIYLYQRFIDTLPAPPHFVVDTAPEIVPLVAPNAAICNIAMKALISLPENTQNNRNYAMSIFKRMIKCAVAAQRNVGLPDRIREIYWGRQRTVDLGDLLIEMTQMLSDAQVLTYARFTNFFLFDVAHFPAAFVFRPKFHHIWLKNDPASKPPATPAYDDPDDDPFRCIYPQMSPNQETLDVVLQAVTTQEEAQLVAAALNAVPALQINTSQLQALETLLGQPFQRTAPVQPPTTTKRES